MVLLVFLYLNYISFYKMWNPCLASSNVNRFHSHCRHWATRHGKHGHVIVTDIHTLVLFLSLPGISPVNGRSQFTHVFNVTSAEDPVRARKYHLGGKSAVLPDCSALVCSSRHFKFISQLRQFMLTVLYDSVFVINN